MNEKEDTREVTGKGGEVKKFSEIYGQTAFDFKGERKTFEEVIGKSIIISDFAPLGGLYGEFFVAQATLTETREIINFPIGSEVIMQQLKRAREDNNLPIQTTIEKRTAQKTKRAYYTLA
jgi:hypothetical protein